MVVSFLGMENNQTDTIKVKQERPNKKSEVSMLTVRCSVFDIGITSTSSIEYSYL